MDDTSTELIKERKASEVEYYSYMSFIASILTTAVCVQSLPCNTESFKAPPRIQETTGKFPELLVACQVSELILIQHLGLGCSTSFNSSTRLIKNDRALVHHQVRVNSRVAAYCCLLHVIGIQDNTAPAKLISAEVILLLFLHWDFYLICKTYLFFSELCGLFVLREWY